MIAIAQIIIVAGGENDGESVLLREVGPWSHSPEPACVGLCQARQCIPHFRSEVGRAAKQGRWPGRRCPDWTRDMLLIYERTAFGSYPKEQKKSKDTDGEEHWHIQIQRWSLLEANGPCRTNRGDPA